MGDSQHSSTQSADSVAEERAPVSESDAVPVEPPPTQLRLESEDLERLIDEELDSLPPVPAEIGVLIFSSDESLIEVVESAGGPQHRIETADEWADVIRSVRDGRSSIVLLDDAAGGGGEPGEPFEARVSALADLENPPVISVAVSRETAERVAELEADERIHRVLMKPAAAGATGFLLQSASDLFLRQRSLTVAMPQTRETAEHTLGDAFASTELPAATDLPTPPELPAATDLPTPTDSSAAKEPPVLTEVVELDAAVAAQPAQARHKPWFVVGVPAAVLLTAFIVVMLRLSASVPLRTDATSRPAASAPETVVVPASNTDGLGTLGPEPTATEADTAEALAATRAIDPPAQPAAAPAAEPPVAQEQAASPAPEEAGFDRPVGDGAAAFYATVFPRTQEPDPQVEVLVEALFTEAESALLEGDLEEAATALGHIRSVRPSSGRLLFLETQLERERAAADIAEEAAAEEQDVANDAEPPGERESLLTIGRARLDQGQLETPAGDSALDYFRRAAEIGGDGDQALEQLRADLLAALADSTRAELEVGNLEQANRLIDQARSLDADAETLALLNLSLSAARQSELLATGLERLANGQIIAPEQDSALYYLTALQSENPGMVGLDPAMVALAAAIDETAASLLDAGEWSTAETWIAALEAADPDSARGQALREEVEFRRAQAEYLAVATSTDELELLESGVPVYPRGAQVRNIEGWVELEFVVDTEGVPTELMVIASEPPGTFEAAALQAASQYRYAPYTRDGRIYQRRVQLRIRFALL